MKDNQNLYLYGLESGLIELIGGFVVFFGIVTFVFQWVLGFIIFIIGFNIIKEIIKIIRGKQ